MTPSAAIASLDQRLVKDGQDIILQRITGAANQATFSANVRAFVRGYQPKDLIGSIVQGDSKVILSPTDIERERWPGPQVVKQTSQKIDVRVPTTNDKAIIAGKTRNIKAATPFYMDGDVLVRIEMQVAG